MISAVRRLERTPPTLRWLIALLVLLPLWSAAALPPPWALELDASRYDQALGVARLLAHFLLPLVALVALAVDATVFLAVLVAETVLLVLLCGASLPDAPLLDRLVRGLFLAAAVGFGLGLMRRDRSIPFLLGRSRLRPGAEPLAFNRKLRLTSPALAEPLVVVMESCTLGGVLVAGRSADLAPLLQPRGQRSVAMAGGKRFEATLDARVAWSRETGELTLVALETADADATEAFLRAIGVSRVALASLDRVWTSRGMRAGAFAAWVTAMTGVVAAPSCGTVERLLPAHAERPVAASARFRCEAGTYECGGAGGKSYPAELLWAPSAAEAERTAAERCARAATRVCGGGAACRPIACEPVTPCEDAASESPATMLWCAAAGPAEQPAWRARIRTTTAACACELLQRAGAPADGCTATPADARGTCWPEDAP